jgi:saccharopine dehydrogenase-like NADP-dependent oxidoreductase
VGGYGEFGGRVSELLLLDGHTVHVAGRSYSKAVTITQGKGGVPKAFDRQLDLADVVCSEFDIVVDAAGPFQTYQESGDVYQLAKRCIEQGVHYLDLSDDGYLSEGIKCLNDQAMASGCVVLPGVSSTPALSSSVVDQLQDQIESLSVIETTILPGSNAPRGRSVMASILGQVGNPMNIWRGCRWVFVRGWSASIPVTVSAEENSARLLLTESRKASFISTPDSVLFPAWFGADFILFRAGLELGFMHTSLSVRGKLRQLLTFAFNILR